MSDLVGNPEDRFSCVAAQISLCSGYGLEFLQVCKDALTFVPFTCHNDSFDKFFSLSFGF